MACYCTALVHKFRLENATRATFAYAVQSIIGYMGCIQMHFLDTNEQILVWKELLSSSLLKIKSYLSI